MSTTFVVSDTHLDHYNIVLHCERTPWIYPNPSYRPDLEYHFKYNNPKKVDIIAHNAGMINNWNSVVGKNDDVWFLGDVAWKYHARFINELNGVKRLIRGNHDKMDSEAFKLFAKIDGSSYQYSYYTEIYGRRVMFSHCPYETWFSSPHGSWHFHGHCHGRLPDRVDLLRIDVGVDCWGFYPVPWDVLEARMIEKEKHKKEFIDARKAYLHETTENDIGAEGPVNTRIEIEAGESLKNFHDNRDRNIALMKKMGVIHEKAPQEKTS